MTPTPFRRAFQLCAFALATPLLALAAPNYYAASVGALAEAKMRLDAGDPALRSALEQLVAEADKALLVTPPTVTDKIKPGASGSLHDYASQAPYLWPDPSKPDGLPYIPRDGVINPESRTDASDQIRVGTLGDAVTALALAYHFTANEAYAEHAARCLRVWFLDPATRMTPHMEQGQAVPGRNTGRAIGIIEAGGMVEAIDASSLLAPSPAWSAADAAGLKQWAAAFLDWLMHSPMGQQEAAMQQNHGTMYDVRAARLALHVGQTHLARRIVDDAKQRRVAVQIEPDGRQPLELRRTKSFNYSRLNLRGLCSLAEIGKWTGVDLWNFETPDGRSIRKALDFMVPYLEDPAKEWPYQQIVAPPRADLAVVLRQAANAYREPAYERLAATLIDLPKARFQLLCPPASPPSQPQL